MHANCNPQRPTWHPRHPKMPPKRGTFFKVTLFASKVGPIGSTLGHMVPKLSLWGLTWHPTRQILGQLMSPKGRKINARYPYLREIVIGFPLGAFWDPWGSPGRTQRAPRPPKWHQGRVLDPKAPPKAPKGHPQTAQKGVAKGTQKCVP